MPEQVSFTLRGRNPDVLTCIANLSNDEVFTPQGVRRSQHEGKQSLFDTLGDMLSRIGKPVRLLVT